MTALISVYDYVFWLLPVAASLGLLGAIFSKQPLIIVVFSIFGGIWVELAAADLIDGRSFSILTVLIAFVVSLGFGLAARAIFTWLSPSYH